MSRTIVSRRPELKFAGDLTSIFKMIDELRGNQNEKSIYADITIYGTGTNGIIDIGGVIYVKKVSATKIGFYRTSDDAILMSLDTSGNLRCLGTITGSVAP